MQKRYNLNLQTKIKMSTLKNLLEKCICCWKQYLDQVKTTMMRKGQWKPSPLVWSISENDTHLFGQSKAAFLVCGKPFMPFGKANATQL